MDFELSDEQRMLQDSVLRFVDDKYGLSNRQALTKSDLGFSAENWAIFAEMGWLGLPFPENIGGFGGTAVDIAVLMEALGGGLVLEPYVSTVLLGGKLVEYAGSSEQQDKILRPVIEGKMHLAFAYAEPNSRYNISDIQMTAVSDGADYILNGDKAVVLHGASADKIIVSCRTSGNRLDETGVSLFVVDKNADGIERRDARTLDGQRASEFLFTNVKVDSSSLLGPKDQAYPIMEKVIDQATSAICAEAVGAMHNVNEITKEYVATRNQFGKAIGSNQVIQHRLVDMHIATEHAKSLSDMAAMYADSSDEDRKQAVSATKAKVGDAARFVGEQGIQLHGGIGMTDEYSIGHYAKRLAVIDMLFGNADFHRARYSQ
ncbi:MAG: acyl-CoA dehydrogenase family protein [Sneathiella sp.]